MEVLTTDQIKTKKIRSNHFESTSFIHNAIGMMTKFNLETMSRIDIKKSEDQMNDKQ